MTRTQVLLDNWQHDFLAALARRKGISVSALLRGWIEEKAAGMKNQPDSLLGLAGIVADGAGDVSENVDDYLYGKKSRRPK